METNKPLTLEEAKDQVAINHDFKDWNNLVFNAGNFQGLDGIRGKQFYNDEAAELYKSSHVSALQAEIEALRKEREWISVEERLPETEIDVLILFKGNEVIAQRIINTTYPEIMWMTHDFYPEYEGVTHWQPLPPKP